jgi:flagellum-specific peptidoglycan hydrolase FlgJ
MDRPKVYHDDDEKGECFRVYATAEESFRDHSDFLKTRRTMRSFSNSTLPITMAGQRV